jgi:hypothetical protein
VNVQVRASPAGAKCPEARSPYRFRIEVPLEPTRKPGAACSGAVGKWSSDEPTDPLPNSATVRTGGAIDLEAAVFELLFFIWQH